MSMVALFSDQITQPHIKIRPGGTKTVLKNIPDKKKNVRCVAKVIGSSMKL